MTLLLQRPALVERVRNDRSLVAKLIDEGVRFEPVSTVKVRQAVRDVEIRGVQIPKDAMVQCVVASANRDEEVFDAATAGAFAAHEARVQERGRAMHFEERFDGPAGVRTLDGHESFASCLAFSPDGRLLGRVAAVEGLLLHVVPIDDGAVGRGEHGENALLLGAAQVQHAFVPRGSELGLTTAATERDEMHGCA